MDKGVHTEVRFIGHMRAVMIQLGETTSARSAWVNVIETEDGFTQLMLIDRESNKGVFLNDEEVQTLIDELKDHLKTKDPAGTTCSICGLPNH